MVGERTTWTSTQLIERGWTRAGINKFLQPCSYTYSFRYHKDVALYKAKTALRIEETPEFKEFFQKSQIRKENIQKKKERLQIAKAIKQFHPEFFVEEQDVEKSRRSIMSKKKTAVSQQLKNDSVERVRELTEWFTARNLDVLVVQMYKLFAELSHDIDYVYENLEPTEWKTGFDAEKLLPWFKDQSEFSDCLKTVQRGYHPTLDDIAECLDDIAEYLVNYPHAKARGLSAPLR